MGAPHVILGSKSFVSALKQVLAQKKLIMTSEWHSEQLLAGQNTQQPLAVKHKQDRQHFTKECVEA